MKTCADCYRSIEGGRLQVLPDTRYCSRCAGNKSQPRHTAAPGWKGHERVRTKPQGWSPRGGATIYLVAGQWEYPLES